jgi:hypothetical protein
MAMRSMRPRLTSHVSHLKPHASSRGGSRPLWLRLVSLALAIGALAAAGAALGRGFAPLSPADIVTHAVATEAPPLVAATFAPAPPSVAVIVVPAAATPAPATGPGQPAPAPTPKPIDASWPALIEEPFELVSASWPEVTERSWRTRYRDGWYELRLTNRPSISYSNPLRAHDFWLGADVRIERGRAGLFFLRRAPNDFYRFLIDAEGRFRLEWQQVGASRPLIDWTPSDALRRGEGQANQVAIRRAGDELTLFANGEPLATYALPPGNTLEGRVGVALDAPEGQRDGAALFDNLLVRAPAE